MKMKLFFITLAVLLFIDKPIHAQGIVLTEIMYASPAAGGGNDTLEFLEFYNNTDSGINMTGYTISSAVTHTFAPLILPSGGYIVVAKKASTAENFYGISNVVEWSAGDLPNNNSGYIRLRDNFGVLLDSVKYAWNAPWPAGSSVTGSTLMLCNPNLDNSFGANWVISTPLNANSYGLINNKYVFGTPGQACISNPPYFPSWASIPFYENFDSSWLTKNWMHDVPDHHWLNTPEKGNRSWRRNDDGISASWNNPSSGAYAIPGALGSMHSARFPSSIIVPGNHGVLDLYLDCNVSGIKRLKFWYNNSDGPDSLSIFMSADSGLTFSLLKSFYSTSTQNWEIKQIDLGILMSPHVIIRFQANSAEQGLFNISNIGIDEVSVSLVQENDAGILAITQPMHATSLVTDTIKVTLKNYSSNPLNSVDINWTMNGIFQTPLHWTGLIPPMSQLNDLLVGFYTFPPNQKYEIRVWTAQPNNTSDPDVNNDTSVKLVFYQKYALLPFIEHFDSSWVDRFSVHDSPDEYWNNVNPYGNTSWRQANDGASAGWINASAGAYTPLGAKNTIQSARFHSAGNQSDAQGILDLFLNFSLPGIKELRFYQRNNDGSDSLDILISTNGGKSFQFLKTFHFVSTWTQRVVLLGNSLSKKVVLRFRATTDYNATTDIGLDEVSVNLIQADAGIPLVVSPVDGCALTSTETVSVFIKNYCNKALDTVPVFYRIDGVLVSDTMAIPLLPGDSVLFSFNQTADLSALGPHNCKFYSGAPADAESLNDSLSLIIYQKPVISSFPYLQDFESGGYTGWNSAFISGMDEWVLGTPNKPPMMDSAHSVVNAWVTGLDTYYHKNTNSYVSSPCFDFSNLNDPGISVWLNFITTSWAAMALEASINEGPWVKVGDTSLYNNKGNHNSPIDPPNWSGVSNGWKLYFANLPSLAHQSNVAFRFRFQSGDFLGGVEGFAIDDVIIGDSLTMNINQLAEESLFIIYPNPAHKQVILTFGAYLGNAKIELMNSYGQIVFQKSIAGSSMEYIDLQKFAPGVYGIILKSGNTIRCRKVIKL